MRLVGGEKERAGVGGEGRGCSASFRLAVTDPATSINKCRGADARHGSSRPIRAPVSSAPAPPARSLAGLGGGRFFKKRGRGWEAGRIRGRREGPRGRDQDLPPSVRASSLHRPKVANAFPGATSSKRGSLVADCAELAEAVRHTPPQRLDSVSYASS